MRIIFGQFADFYLCSIRVGGNKAPRSSHPAQAAFASDLFSELAAGRLS
jgi:hypothetical protein